MLTIDIFISFSNGDRQYTRALGNALKRFGWTVWWSDSDNPGSSDTVKIQAALKASRAVIVVWSKKAAGSKFVTREVESVTERQGPIFVCIDDESVPESLVAAGETYVLRDWTRLESSSFFRSTLDPYQSFDVDALAASSGFLKINASLEIRLGRPSNTLHRSRWKIVAGIAGGFAVLGLIALAPWRWQSFNIGATDIKKDEPHSGYVGTRVPYAKRAIVFVHGVLGNSVSTWTSSKTKAYWPRLVRGDDAFKESDVFVYNYESSLYNTRLTISDLAANLDTALTTYRIFDDHQQVIFVAHSMGGLVVRSFLIKFQSKYAQHVPLLFFVATPSTGSQLTKLAALIDSNNPQFKNLEAWNEVSYVKDLADFWDGTQFKAVSFCAFEKVPMLGSEPVVDEVSARFLCNEAVAIDRNHVDIAKPDRADDGGVYDAFKAAYIKGVERKSVSPPTEPNQR